MNKPSLLILASTYPRWSGDAEPGFVHELAKRLTASFRVTVVCPHAPGALLDEELDGVRIVRFRYAPTRWERLVHDGGMVINLRRNRLNWLLVPFFFLSQWLVARRIAREESVDVIHAHWLLPQGLIAAYLRPFARSIPFLVTSHGADLYALRGALPVRLKRMVIARAAATTVVSRAMVEPIIALGAEATSVSVQPMGVDFLERFRPDPSIARSSDELLFVGRLVEKKGLRHLIDAMPHIRADRPSAFLTIVGFGPELENHKTRAQELGLQDCIRFVGPQPQQNLTAHYLRAAVFVAPFVRAASGDEEGLGLVVAEAVACLCPVVVSDLPATRDLIDERVPPGDPKALASHIVRLLRMPSEVRNAKAQDLRTRLLNKMSWEHVATGYESLLRSLSERT